MFNDMNAELMETVVSIESDRGDEARHRGELLEKVFHIGEILAEIPPA